MIDVNRAIANAVKTGKTFLGVKRVVKNVKMKKTRLVVFASNCPSRIQGEVEYYCHLGKTPTYTYRGTGLDLGAACGKRFAISVLAVREPGESEILKLVETNT